MYSDDNSGSGQGIFCSSCSSLNQKLAEVTKERDDAIEKCIAFAIDHPTYELSKELEEENKSLRELLKTITGSPEKNAANQINFSRRLVEDDKMSTQEHDDQVLAFRKNV